MPDEIVVVFVRDHTCRNAWKPVPGGLQVLLDANVLPAATAGLSLSERDLMILSFAAKKQGVAVRKG